MLYKKTSMLYPVNDGLVTSLRRGAIVPARTPESWRSVMSEPRAPAEEGFESCEARGRRMIPPLVAFGVIYVAAIAALRFVPMPRAAMYATALAPAPLFAFYLRRWILASRGLDELQRQIHFEALAIA